MSEPVNMRLTQQELKVLLLQMNHVSLSLVERAILKELREYFTKYIRVVPTGVCEHPCKIPIGTQRIQKCIDCGLQIEWNLDTDQVSAYGDTSEKVQRDYKD